MRTAKFTFIFIVVAVFVLAVVAGIFLALHPRRRRLLEVDQQQAREMADSNAADLTDISILANDGVILRAWNFQPQKSFGYAVILSHGLSDNRAGMMGYAQFFLRHGYDVLMPDARAHGMSGGQIATYGIRESNDLHRWLNWLAVNEHPSCIYGFAESMGAAGLLQSLHSESRFCAVAGRIAFFEFSRNCLRPCRTIFSHRTVGRADYFATHRGMRFYLREMALPSEFRSRLPGKSRGIDTGARFVDSRAS
jgi:predicted alpha/beta-fold hydrolase